MDGQSITAVQTETNHADFFVPGRHFRNRKSDEVATFGADPGSVFSHCGDPLAASLFSSSGDVKDRCGIPSRSCPMASSPNSAVAIDRKCETQSFRSAVDGFVPLSSDGSAVLRGIVLAIAPSCQSAKSL
jgi:hypothetical protein